MIARDELAARFAVEAYGTLIGTKQIPAPWDNVDRAGVAERAVKMADALLSALAVPPAAPDAPVRAALRLLAAPYGTQEWREAGDALSRLAAPNGMKAALAALDTPAPSPTSYVPKVGDVVTWGARECLYRVDDDGVLRPCDKRVKCALAVTMTDVAVRGIDLSPASASERAAAGLPVDEATTPPAATPAYPVDAAGRPLWVRITGPKRAVKVTVGKTYRVVGWHDDRGGGPIINSDTNESWLCYPKDEADDVFPAWEPCAAPTDAVTPAAALTEEEREGLARELCDCCENEGGTYDGYGRNARADWLRTADAAAAWFAKRDGTVKP